MKIELIIERIAEVAESGSWQKLPALDQQLRQAFTEATHNCPPGEEEALLTMISKAQDCYSNVIALCESKQEELKNQQINIQKSRKVAQQYSLAS